VWRNPTTGDAGPCGRRTAEKGLREAGFVEGQTVGIDYRWADGRYDQLAAMAADLVGRKVSVLVRFVRLACGHSPGRAMYNRDRQCS
jgi:hypothetical protein